MNELGGISKHLTALTTLEKSLHLKQMQISGLHKYQKIINCELNLTLEVNQILLIAR